MRQPMQQPVVQAALERLLVAQQLVGNGADGKDIAPKIDRASEHLLRRHVIERPDHRAVLRHGRPFDAGDAEVKNPHDALSVHHDVRRFDVPVDDPGMMGEVEAGADLFEVRDLVGQSHIPPLLDDVGERFAVDELHGHVRLVVLLAAGVNRDDVRVTQGGGRPRFTKEPVQNFLVVHLLPNHLDRHLPVQFRIAAEVDGAHPPGANLPEDLEVADSRRDCYH